MVQIKSYSTLPTPVVRLEQDLSASLQISLLSPPLWQLYPYKAGNYRRKSNEVCMFSPHIFTHQAKPYQSRWPAGNTRHCQSSG